MKQMTADHSVNAQNLISVEHNHQRYPRSKSDHMRNLAKKPTNIAEYLDQLPDDQRTALVRLRMQILLIAPGAEEHLSYGLPAFKLNGHPLIYFGAAKEHCAIYGSVPKGLAEKLKGFAQSKGTIKFTPKKPIPAALVKEIVKAKVMENELKWGAGSFAKKTAPKKK